jgi:hypothetical protein
MSRGSPTISFRITRAEFNALAVEAMQRRISPYFLARNYLRNGMAGDGLMAHNGAHAGANTGFPFTPETAPPPAILAEEFRGGLYMRNRKLATAGRSPAPSYLKPAPAVSGAALFREGPSGITAAAEALQAPTLNSPPKSSRPQTTVYLPGSPFAPKR